MSHKGCDNEIEPNWIFLFDLIDVELISYPELKKMNSIFLTPY